MIKLLDYTWKIWLHYHFTGFQCNNIRQKPSGNIYQKRQVCYATSSVVHSTQDPGFIVVVGRPHIIVGRHLRRLKMVAGAHMVAGDIVKIQRQKLIGDDSNIYSI